MGWWKLKAQLGYWLARKLFNQRWAVGSDRIWEWMQGQFARMAAFDNTEARAFYGHLLLHKGQGIGARQEGVRLLRLAAQAGDSRSAWQLGSYCLQETVRQPADPQQAADWFELALQLGHPAAVAKLEQLYGEQGPEATRDPRKLQRIQQQQESFGD